MTRNPTISLVLPCLNEEGQIEKTVESAYEWFAKNNHTGEIIVVNNGSTDHTAECLERLQITHPDLVIVQRAYTGGYGASLISGCDRAKMDIVVMMDSDGQFSPEDINRLLPHLETVDFVGGMKEARQDSFVRKFESAGWNFLLRIFLNIRAKDIDCGMKAFKRSIWEKIRPTRADNNLFSGELYVRLERNSLPWTQETVRHLPRKTGKAKGATLGAIAKSLLELAAFVLSTPSKTALETHKISPQILTK